MIHVEGYEYMGKRESGPPRFIRNQALHMYRLILRQSKDQNVLRFAMFCDLSNVLHILYYSTYVRHTYMHTHTFFAFFVRERLLSTQQRVMPTDEPFNYHDLYAIHSGCIAHSLCNRPVT